jgi:hypothetical protein
MRAFHKLLQLPFVQRIKLLALLITMGHSVAAAVMLVVAQRGTSNL